jgi:hypothetical protein
VSKGPWSAETRERRGCLPYVAPIVQHYGGKAEWQCAFYWRKKYIEEFGMWPERRHDHPETVEQTLARIK